MNRVFAECATTLDELRRDPAAVLATAGDEAVAILDQDKPAAYLISADAFEKLLERLDDAELAAVVKQRQLDLDQAVDVTLDELCARPPHDISAPVPPHSGNGRSLTRRCKP
jgi:antitoxin StbD